MLDLTLLRLCRNREDFQRLRYSVDTELYTKELGVFIKLFKDYYDIYTDHTTVDLSIFAVLLEQRVLSVSEENTQTIYKAILKQIFSSTVDSTTRDNFLDNLISFNTVHKLNDIIQAFTSNEEVDAIEEVKKILHDHDSKVSRSKTPQYVTNIDAVLNATEADSGLHWGIPCLDANIRPLRAGDFGLVAARVDKGKTSLMAYFVAQMLKDLEEGETVEWFNNEGLAVNILPRVMQAVLNCTIAELGEKSKAGTLYEEFYALGGNKIRIRDCHGLTVWDLESIIKVTKPRLVIYDMLAKFRGFSLARKDLELESLCDFAREQSAIHKHSGIATCQISLEGADQEYPDLSCIKDSKTGMQGAADFCLFMGSLNDDTYAGHRWISDPKNKLRRLGGRAIKQQLLFKAETCQFTEV